METESRYLPPLYWHRIEDDHPQALYCYMRDLLLEYNLEEEDVLILDDNLQIDGQAALFAPEERTASMNSSSRSTFFTSSSQMSGRGSNNDLSPTPQRKWDPLNDTVVGFASNKNRWGNDSSSTAASFQSPTVAGESQPSPVLKRFLTSPPPPQSAVPNNIISTTATTNRASPSPILRRPSPGGPRRKMISHQSSPNPQGPGSMTSSSNSSASSSSQQPTTNTFPALLPLLPPPPLPLTSPRSGAASSSMIDASLARPNRRPSLSLIQPSRKVSVDCGYVGDDTTGLEDVDYTDDDDEDDDEDDEDDDEDDVDDDEDDDDDEDATWTDKSNSADDVSLDSDDDHDNDNDKDKDEGTNHPDELQQQQQRQQDQGQHQQQNTPSFAQQASSMKEVLPKREEGVVSNAPLLPPKRPPLSPTPRGTSSKGKLTLRQPESPSQSPIKHLDGNPNASITIQPTTITTAAASSSSITSTTHTTTTTTTTSTTSTNAATSTAAAGNDNDKEDIPVTPNKQNGDDGQPTRRLPRHRNSFELNERKFARRGAIVAMTNFNPSHITLLVEEPTEDDDQDDYDGDNENDHTVKGSSRHEKKQRQNQGRDENQPLLQLQEQEEEMGTNGQNLGEQSLQHEPFSLLPPPPPPPSSPIQESSNVPPSMFHASDASMPGLDDICELNDAQRKQLEWIEQALRQVDEDQTSRRRDAIATSLHTKLSYGDTCTNIPLDGPNGTNSNHQRSTKDLLVVQPPPTRDYVPSPKIRKLKQATDALKEANAELTTFRRGGFIVAPKIANKELMYSSRSSSSGGGSSSSSSRSSSSSSRKGSVGGDQENAANDDASLGDPEKFLHDEEGDESASEAPESNREQLTNVERAIRIVGSQRIH